MKEIRILLTDIPKWDDDEWEDLELELKAVINRWVSKHDYTYVVWDVD